MPIQIKRNCWIVKLSNIVKNMNFIKNINALIQIQLSGRYLSLGSLSGSLFGFLGVLAICDILYHGCGRVRMRGWGDEEYDIYGERKG